MRRKFKRLTAFLLSAAMVFPLFGEYPSGTFDFDWNFDWSVSAEGETDDGVPDLNDNGTADDTSDDYYEIGTADELYWFMEYVNAGNKSVNAVLTDNIVVNSGTFSTDNAGNPLYNGEAISETNKPVEWTPINTYTGTFNGQNHTISGLYFNNTSQSYVGLFGITNEGAQIKNVGVINLSFISKGSVGGICACNDKGTITNCYSSGTVSGASYYVGGVCGRNQSGTITNCYNTGDVSGSEDVGGVCGINQTNGTITNCYNTGDVSGNVYVGGVCGSNYDATITNCYSRGTVSGSEKVGGVCGYNNLGTVTNCYSRGTVSGSEDVGGVCGYNNLGTVTNCYYDSTVYTGDAVGYSNGTTTDVEGKTTAQFASGEIAYLLNGSSSENVTWYQKLLTDTYPVLDSKHGKVYYVFKCDGETPAGYSNENKNEPHIDENGDEYCDDCGVIYNGIGAHLAGYSVSLNGSIGVNFHMDLTQDVLDDNEAYMLFTLPNGTTQKVMVSDARAKEPAVIEGKTYYIFTCNVAAKEMTDTIQAQLITSDGSQTQVYEYSVREYADRILSDMSGSYDDETKELVKAMLHYGAYSQEWFDYNTTNLANAGLGILDLSDADDWSEFNPSISNNDKVGSFTSAYLTLESDTAINLKFKLADGVSFEDLRVVVEDTIGNVVPATIVTTGNVCLITLTGIKASDLDTMYDFSVTDGKGNESAILYSAMSYARAVANSDMDQKLKDVTAALRIFNLRANEKFEY